MDYKSEIIRLVNNIQSERILKLIHDCIKNLMK